MSSTCTITRIIDGDTVIAELSGTSTRIRLVDIDAPELAQPDGLASRDYLVSLTTNHTITIHSIGRDRYGRTLATLFTGNRDINLTMVRTGHAWRYRYARKTGAIAEAESLARAEGRGLWARDGAVAPWEFRRGCPTSRQGMEKGDFSAETKRRDISFLPPSPKLRRTGRLLPSPGRQRAPAEVQRGSELNSRRFVSALQSLIYPSSPQPEPKA